MATGIVKWFNAEKGFGFAAQGFRELQEGRKAEFDVTQAQTGPQAENIRPV
ncbi:cold-shock protein [Streptomyces sp. MJM1172]|uniref:cold-shock protein n=1 Tax=Streptomyces sp. MJM1172 TaxID=1703926 RepID=UPI00093DE7F1|nr:cold shock domain-containing protein [Streptomyces sp. MJM1172]OKI49091.1 cold-shock protein [Streptomyces sp. MJM1172]